MAQQDTVSLDISLNQTFSSQGYLPHYLAANRFGLLDFADDDVSWLGVRSEGRYSLLKNLEVLAGLEVIGKAGIDEGGAYDAFLQQVYAGVKFYFLQFTAGSMQRTSGTTAAELSSGSLALSQNAQPMPMLLLSVPEYTDVPFTNGYLQFKGTYAHSWFGEDRFIKNVWLHEKSLYARAGIKLVKLYGGLVHQVIWGGTHPVHGEMPRSMSDYFSVITGGSAKNINPDIPLFGEQANALGDNLGIYDFGMYIHTNIAELELYYQIPYEDRSGTQIWNNRDQLFGLHIKKSNQLPWLPSLIYEYLDTRYQSGPGLTDPIPGDNGNYGYEYGGRDNYYNNYLYRSGWTYQERVLGNPLFLTKHRVQFYLPGFTDPDERYFNFDIISNRIIAHHVGLNGRINPQIEYKFLATFSNNYGTYGGLNGGITNWGSITDPDLEYAFNPPLNQNYFLLETSLPLLEKRIRLSASLALDRGELTNNFGFMVGMKWQHSWFLKNE